MFSLQAVAQDLSIEEKIVIKACSYLDSIDNYSVLQDSLQGSITTAMATVMSSGTDDERKLLSNVLTIRTLLKNAVEELPLYCPNVRRLIIEHKTEKFYKRSNISQANEHFDIGNEFMKNGKFKNAVKEFKKAIKIDPNFVYAIDHLAISYRQQNKYKKAVKVYKESLEIFPEANIALMNLAVCYSLLNEEEKAIKCYEDLKYYHPNNPEGYFGLAKLSFLKKEYEKALDNIFIAHKLYVASNSEYLTDSKKLISYLYSQLSKEDKLEL
ncbi:MAG: tetratricopeptide repeat protein, partial [Nitrososphaeraceae archaeon]|nr:tetratricopeptide repeat protein [Nitrososphaeraceae archaeon]